MPLSESDKADLVAYLDGELDEQATQAVEAKLATDADARAELDTLKQTWGMLDYLPKASPSPNFTNRTMEKLSLEKIATTLPMSSSKPIPAPPHRTTWPAKVGWAAAVVLAIGLGYVGAPHVLPLIVPTDPSAQEADEALIRHLRIVEKWRYYENVDDRDFIDKLGQPELFGEEPS